MTVKEGEGVVGNSTLNSPNLEVDKKEESVVK